MQWLRIHLISPCIHSLQRHKSHHILFVLVSRPYSFTMLWVLLRFLKPPWFLMAIISSSLGSSAGAVFGATIRLPEAVRLSPSAAMGAGGGGGAMGGAGGGGGGILPI